MGINFFSKSHSILVIDNENKSHLSEQSLVRLFENFTGVVEVSKSLIGPDDKALSICENLVYKLFLQYWNPSRLFTALFSFCWKPFVTSDDLQIFHPEVRLCVLSSWCIPYKDFFIRNRYLSGGFKSFWKVLTFSFYFWTLSSSVSQQLLSLSLSFTLIVAK